MTPDQEHKMGTRIAVLIITVLCALCVLASLSGCLTATKIHRWESALLTWHRRGDAVPRLTRWMRRSRELRRRRKMGRNKDLTVTVKIEEPKLPAQRLEHTLSFFCMIPACNLHSTSDKDIQL